MQECLVVDQRKVCDGGLVLKCFHGGFGEKFDVFSPETLSPYLEALTFHIKES